MKISKKALFTFCVFTLLTSITIALDEDKKSSVQEESQIPPEISSVIKLEKGEKPYLIAQYEPEKGNKYYIFDIASDSFIRTSFFKVEDGKAAELGRDDEPYPFARFIKEAQAIEPLWQDFLARWIKRDGRENLQQRLDLRDHEQITEEEAIHFEKAGFKVPKTMKRVKEYEDPLKN